MTGEAKRRALITSRRVKRAPCLNCGAPLGGVTGPDKGDPNPGSIMVCAYCSHIMQWAAEGFEELDDETIKEIAGDPHVMAIVEATAIFRAKQRPAKCAGCGASNPYGKMRCETCGKPLVFPDD